VKTDERAAAATAAEPAEEAMAEDGPAAAPAVADAKPAADAAAEAGPPAAAATAVVAVAPVAAPTVTKREAPHKESAEEAAARRRAEVNLLRRAAALREAQAKAVRAASMPAYNVPRTRCHWDFVLAEMAWMATDFAGERLWKMCAAAELGAAAAAANGAPQVRKVAQEEARRATVARATAGITGACASSTRAVRHCTPQNPRADACCLPALLRAAAQSFGCA
jgi:hypothetical protein